MKTLILFATKYGTAGITANKIADEINGAVICDLKKDTAPPLKDFDCVIIGSSVYVGAVHKEVKDFIINNKETLLTKKLGIFICGLEEGKARENLTANFPKELLEHAVSAEFLGGVYDPKRVNVLERLAMKVIAKYAERTDTTDGGKVSAFVKKMTE